MPTLLFSHRITLIAQLLASRKIVGDLSLITLLSVVAAAATQPNIVLILADDMSWVGTSVNMDPDRPDSKSDYYQTPALEQLAREGMRFTDAYAPHPNCSPTRLAIQTGMTPAKLKMTDIINRNSGRFYEGLPMIPPQHINHIPHEETTIAELLKLHRPGYVTGHFGKWHLGGGGPGKHGYDEHSGSTSNAEGGTASPDPKRTVSVTTRALDFLKHRQQANEPFFLQVSYYAVHLGIFAFEETIQKFSGMPAGERHNHAAHAAMVHELDRGVGRILETLDKLDLADNTYVIFTSDNGSYHHQRETRVTTNAPLRGQKASTWEGGIRVPLIVRGPGIEKGSHNHVTVTGTDLYATIADMVQLQAELAQRLESASLLDLLQQGEQGTLDRKNNSLVWHFPHYQTDKGTSPMSSIRDGKWKLVKLYESGRALLFNLEQDIGESNDLSYREARVATALEKQLMEYLESIEAPMAQLRQ